MLRAEQLELMVQLMPQQQTGDQRLASILSSMSHFIPQLALSKQFDTTVADALLGAPAPAVSTYWKQMVTHLMATNWRCVTEAAA